MSRVNSTICVLIRGVTVSTVCGSARKKKHRTVDSLGNQRRLPSERLIFLHQHQYPREQTLSWSCVLGIVDSSSEKWFIGTLQSLNNLSYANTLKAIASRLHATFSFHPGHKVFHVSHRIEV